MRRESGQQPSRVSFRQTAPLHVKRTKVKAWRAEQGCRPGSGWNWAWRILREHEGIVSGCEVNRLIARLYGERLPSIDLAHVDLSRGEQRPEQHGCGVC